MKQLRAEGIQKLLEQARSDAVHLLRLSRDDETLQEWIGSAVRSYDKAERRINDILEERANA